MPQKSHQFSLIIRLGFLSIIVLLAVCMSVLNYYLVKKYILDHAQEQIRHDLETVRMVYQDQLEKIQSALSLVWPDMNLEELKAKTGLDYVYVIDADQAASAKSAIVREVARVGRSMGATRVMESDELKQIGMDVYNKLVIPIKATPKARPTDRQTLDSAMVLEFARPFRNTEGKLLKVIYAGKILNKNFGLVDEIRNAVFEKSFYDSKPLGTVTIFEDDVRVTTNVLDKNGERAVGTRISDEVYRQVVEKGGKWFARAFVVTDWYITAYEPIKDLEGKIIGVLYLGILEKPFRDLERNVFMVVILIILFASGIALVFSTVLTNSLLKPLKGVMQTIRLIHHGDLSSKIQTRTPIRELNELILSFNDMAHQLHQREVSLAESNDKLATLNKNYLNLVGFVSHELKGMLASSILNVSSVREGFLGEVTVSQKKALDSVSRNLENLSYTIRNFLNLSRFEKGELSVEKRPLRLKEDVFDHAIEDFQPWALEKGMTIKNNLAEAIVIKADLELIRIVANNLIRNAIKYGAEGGKIVITCQQEADDLCLDVYNDGTPIAPEDIDKLFKKFSKLQSNESKKQKGTGLGLFIVRQIIEKHGGQVRVCPRSDGNSFVFNLPKNG